MPPEFVVGMRVERLENAAAQRLEAEKRIAVIQAPRRAIGYEELRPARIGRTGAGHGQGACRSIGQIRIELFVDRGRHAGRQRIDAVPVVDLGRVVAALNEAKAPVSAR